MLVFVGSTPELHRLVPAAALPYIGIVVGAAGFYLRLRTSHALRGTAAAELLAPAGAQ